jgi:hypothetical protein
MQIVDMAIHSVVCQKSDFHRNRNFPKARPFTNASKKNQAKICYHFKDILVQEIDSWCIAKVE